MKGYKRVAAWMGTYPSQGMVSRFSALNIQNLLYMQAEIFTLQSDLTELEEADAASPYPLRQKFATDWFELSSSKDNGSDEQWKLVLLIREKLQVYSKSNLMSRYICWISEIVSSFCLMYVLRCVQTLVACTKRL